MWEKSHCARCYRSRIKPKNTQRNKSTSTSVTKNDQLHLSKEEIDPTAIINDQHQQISITNKNIQIPNKKLPVLSIENTSNHEIFQKENILSENIYQIH